MFIVDAKKSEENVSVINKKIAVSGLTGKVSVAVVLASMLSLAACGGGGSGASATGGVSTGGGSTACNDIAGEPDILGAITYTPATAKPGDTVIMHVPVDAETLFIGAELVGFGASGSIVGGSTATLTGTSGYVTVSSSGAKTVDVPLTVSSISGAGNYFVTINICSADVNACNKVNGTGGVAVSYGSNPVITTAKLLRFKYFANGSEISPSFSNLGTEVCDAQPILTVTAP